MMQAQLFDIPLNQNDIVYTQDNVARAIVAHYNPIGLCLDPCRGDGAFFRHLPPGSDWCEIEEGKDFFAYNCQVNWIVGNPPYSIYYEWLVHSFEIASNIVYLIPTQKIFSSLKMIELVAEFGGIREVAIFGSGRAINLPFGFIVGVVHYQKGYTGCTQIHRPIWVGVGT
jgi:hypothetical protein